MQRPRNDRWLTDLEAPAAVLPIRRTYATPPLTSHQSSIASLELAANAAPSSSSAQLALLTALSDLSQHASILRIYQAALDGKLGEQGKTVIKDQECWGLFVIALARSGRLAELSSFVTRREAMVDQLKSGHTAPATPVSAPEAPEAAVASAAASTAIPPAPEPATGLRRLFSSSSLPPPPPQAATPLPEPGTPLSPLYVQIAPPTPQANLMKTVRWMLGLLLWGFVILTVMAMVMENMGVLKAGSGPMEFEPEEGKVVKFADVHGVEEAKSVRRSSLQLSCLPTADSHRNSKRSLNS